MAEQEYKYQRMNTKFMHYYPNHMHEDPLYKQWAKDKPPEFNMWEYLEFKKELYHATRLEF